MINRKILITGANGFIGKALLSGINEPGCAIIPLVRKPAGLRNEIAVDFCSSNFKETIDSLPKADVVIHLGARVDLGKAKETELFEPNVLATAQLADWAYKNKSFFIYASTAIVCGAKNPHIDCKSKINPDTAYGYSKWLAEETIKMSGVKHAIFRIAGVFGRSGPHHLGINKTIDGAINNTVPVQIGTGDAKRNYIYVKDLCSVIKFCYERDIQGVHFAAGSCVNTVAEMLRIICDVFLPGRQPEHAEGSRACDQIVAHSDVLPKTRSFFEAIEDIKKYG
jgi:nucleoside-diphosphate-sugar epimerase